MIENGLKRLTHKKKIKNKMKNLEVVSWFWTVHERFILIVPWIEVTYWQPFLLLLVSTVPPFHVWGSLLRTHEVTQLIGCESFFIFSVLCWWMIERTPFSNMRNITAGWQSESVLAVATFMSLCLSFSVIFSIIFSEWVYPLQWCCSQSLYKSSSMQSQIFINPNNVHSLHSSLARVL